MGWLFGLKLHLICNEHGELLNFMITSGDVDDRKPLEYKYFVEFVYEKLVGDKGYFLSFYSKIISFPEKIDQIRGTERNVPQRDEVETCVTH